MRTRYRRPSTAAGQDRFCCVRNGFVLGLTFGPAAPGPRPWRERGLAPAWLCGARPAFRRLAPSPFASCWRLRQAQPASSAPAPASRPGQRFQARPPVQPPEPCRRPVARPGFAAVQDFVFGHTMPPPLPAARVECESRTLYVISTSLSCIESYVLGSIRPVRGARRCAGRPARSQNTLHESRRVAATSRPPTRGVPGYRFPNSHLSGMLCYLELIED